ncbi:DUF3375 domain-containing protein [Actinomyces qiguomingii]|uniref:DUF3375 domain-containing protein n=1 Tax=Actinomyces qiguomingii TaxID=2057800 RepID=UPI000CA07D22|nr:DUF3375 domain-containing protein [Actinomyces qiguomingii]
MSAVTMALALQRLREQSPILALMRQETMPVVAAELATYLGGEDRSLPAAELYELIDADLEELRRQGFELDRTARAYCADWLRSGLLIRHPAPAGRGEVFELSPAGHDAIRFLEKLAEPRSTVTESRLTMIMDELERLAHDTDDSLGSRLSALEAERRRIDERIARTRAGDFAPADPRVAAARLMDVMRDARDVPADFARVRQSMASLNRRLRQDLIEDDSPQGDVLEDVFLGVDRIHDSPEGRSFDAFYGLVMDAESGSRFTDAVDALAARPLTEHVPAGTMAYLSDYLLRLQEESLDVSRTMGNFSRSLRQFVQSRQFEAYRELGERLRAAQHAGVEAAGSLRLLDRMEWQMELTTASLRSVGRLALHVPSEVEAPRQVTTRRGTAVDWQTLHALVRESEIDFEELRANVARTLRARGPATIGQVLAQYPATQGLASVVGLYVLGTRHGRPTGKDEHVSWRQGEAMVAARVTSTYRFENPEPFEEPR